MKSILRKLGLYPKQTFHELVLEAGGEGCIVQDPDGNQWYVGGPDWSGYICYPYPKKSGYRMVSYGRTGYKLVRKAK